ncbi:MAG: LysR family transcriptional regulator [Clostridia bacterium]|nr:LysR family transcriptional regulator [Clostridia bacterium]
MDTEKLRAFLCVLQHGTISGAAETLGYTTSGISRLIASLEADAGFPLLKRNHSGVAPTEECTSLLPAMEDLVRNAERYDQLTAKVRGVEMGTVTIGTAYGAYYRPLSSIIAGFTKEHPGIRVQIVEGTSSQLRALLDTHHADICVISHRPGVARWIPLVQDELVALVAQDHPAIADGCFAASRFCEEPFIELYPGRETDNSLFFEEAGIKPNTRFSTYDVHAGVAMVEAGLGVTLTNSLWGKSLTGRVVALRLDPPVRIDIGIATLPLATLAPAVKCFIAYAESRL